MEEETTLEEWKSLPAKTLEVSDKQTRLPIREIVAFFADTCPHWSFIQISGVEAWLPLPTPNSSTRSFGSFSTRGLHERENADQPPDQADARGVPPSRITGHHESAFFIYILG